MQQLLIVLASGATETLGANRNSVRLVPIRMLLLNNTKQFFIENMTGLKSPGPQNLS